MLAKALCCRTDLIKTFVEVNGKNINPSTKNLLIQENCFEEFLSKPFSFIQKFNLGVKVE